MILRYIRITAILISFIFLTGFMPFLTLLAPGYTVATSGSIYKAGAQYLFNKSIKNKTGKNSLSFVKERIESKDDTKYYNQKLKQLVKKRIELARKKLNPQNINQ
jgi:hypothetical protein|tara:strand:- start:13 stop:327 length:315 start_codon:yes stop_codon:yes gene_type:complete